ncbi:UPF0104 family protein [Methanosphaera sp. WGK6]|uniref:UPF0104 family protein n=1 Tax=Methanosphaera sp. WGK6 TaxID=1561964 RepID=UPI00084C3CA9|nr:UPF0104 family protein [Methanosphaera sp. WGK6]OED29701.1 membrane protein [Methanosphaera sp. WGK6]
MDYKKVFGLLLVGLIILAGMIIFIGPGEVMNALQQANMKYVILAIIIQFIIMSLWDIKWSVILDGVGVPHKKLQLFAMLLVGLALNNLTPSGRSGGEPVRAYLVSKSSGKSFKTTFATVIGDKIFDIFPFTVLALAAITYLIFTLHLSQSIIITLIIAMILFIAIIAFLIYICFNEALGIRVIKWVFRQLRRFMSRDLDTYEFKTLEALIDFQESLKYLLKDQKIFSAALTIAFIVWFLEILRVYVVFLAFGVNVSLGMVASVFLLSTLVGMIPALPGGIGTIDGIMIIVYSLAGISPFISTAVTLIERLISFWMVSIMGLLILPYFGTGVLDEVSTDS